MMNEKSFALRNIVFAAIFTGLVACSSPEQKAASYVEKGTEFLKAGDAEKAKIEFKNALQLKKTSLEAIYGLALVAEKEGNWQQMYGLLSEVLLKDPKHIQAQVKFGNLLLAANQMDKATEVNKKLLELAPNDVDVLNFMAAYSLKNNDAASAVKYATMALEKKPDSGDSLIILASERVAAKDFKEAIGYLDKGLKIDNKNIACRLMKIKILEDINETNQADAEYSQLIQTNPQVYGFRRMYTAFLLKHNRKDDAEKVLRALVKDQPKDLTTKLDLVNFIGATKGAQAGRVELESLSAADPDNYDLKFALYDLYEKLKDEKAAKAVLDSIISEQADEPTGLKAKGYLAVNLLRQNKKSDAIKLVDEILEKDARNELALTLKAGFETDNRDYDNAIAHLRSILRDNPNSAKTLLMLARVHDLTGDNALSEEHFVRALKASKHEPQFGLEYAQYLLRRKQPDRAENIIKEVLDVHPQDIPALRALAQVKISRGDLAGAQEIADKIKEMSNSGVVADQLTGIIQSSQKNYTEGIAAFKRVYEAAPGSTFAMADLVASYMNAGKIQDAKSFLQAKLAEKPDNLEASLLLAQVHLRSGDKPAAMGQYEAVIAKHPKSPVGYRELATLYIQSRRVADAQRIIKTGLDMLPEDLSLKLVQAGIFEMNNQAEEAIKSYSEIYKLNPGADVAANNLASLLSDARSDKESLQQAYKISSIFKQSESPYFMDTYGWAAYRVGKYDDAVATLREVVLKAPNVAIFHYHFGMAQISKGEKVSAKASLEKAIELAAQEGQSIPMDAAKKALATL